MAALAAVLVGAGQRGADVYGAFALRHPDRLRFMAVAEPDADRRGRFAQQHHIPPARQFDTWETLFAQERLGEVAFICTQDQAHTAPTLASLAAGYDILLEKPMAVSEADCRELVRQAELAQRQLHIAHVLRYSPHFRQIKKILQAGELGDVVHIAHAENVAFWHMAHSYVRGNWRSTTESAPMILAKCCHDFDILLWLLDRSCTSLSSTGGLLHFRPENAPPGAPLRCTDGCPVEDSCPYYAPLIYLDLLPLWRSVQATSASALVRRALAVRLQHPAQFKRLSAALPPLRQAAEYQGWPVSTVAQPATPANVLAALQTGPYGRCVYHCDNDVVDHQVVWLEFEGGITASLTMHGFANVEGRTTRIQGTHGELQAFLGQAGSWVEVSEHASGRKTRYDTSGDSSAGHGGGDDGLILAFLNALQAGSSQHSLSTAHQALESHLLAFRAEESRLEQKVIVLEQ
jgi:predicted dehydrogenase